MTFRLLYNNHELTFSSISALMGYIFYTLQFYSWEILYNITSGNSENHCRKSICLIILIFIKIHQSSVRFERLGGTFRRSRVRLKNTHSKIHNANGNSYFIYKTTANIF